MIVGCVAIDALSLRQIDMHVQVLRRDASALGDLQILPLSWPQPTRRENAPTLDNRAVLEPFDMDWDPSLKGGSAGVGPSVACRQSLCAHAPNVA